jgi:FixJ family two-component response regulator
MIASQSRVLRFAPFPPHFLPIADVQMPGMPGFELHQCLLASEAHSNHPDHGVS